MSKLKKTAGVWQDAVIWHVNDVGMFFWGSPEARLDGIATEEGHRATARDRKAFREKRGADKTLPIERQRRGR